ncbi:efflux RND transporter periplasmic adaptor subunit [Sulfuriroseicoccus oceanibius]|uniref:Efflux RND transporter periplasmic adaptor subunit n=1 Tax=Sulfuriroseicoccus oceanibius TaxID=2707525 RepID=A0A6B3LEX8_9BACT|nr:efflux RND transporter periplasmic adaptor subunit [Sulfuriroseicoccus oceanibius]QQL45742.1 efflux RND transporter periplasmic adaptor subunit [Sulfuriroseicoccus oceanibius]
MNFDILSGSSLAGLRTILAAALCALMVVALPSCGGDDQVADGEGAVAEVWTCSMHPSVRSDKFGACPICGMDLIKLDPNAEDLGPRRVSFSDEAVALGQFVTAPVVRKLAEVEVRLAGRVELDETQVRTMTARFPARLDRLFLDYTGIRVNSGDHLAKVYSPELLVAQQELITAARTNPKGASANAAREKLRLWGFSAEQIAAVVASGKASDRTDIEAPVGGVVTERFVSEGDYVKTGDQLFELAAFDKVWVVFDAYESDLPWLRFGQRLEFTLDAVPGQSFTARVAYIDPILNPRTRTAKVRINLDNPDELVKPGMLATGKVIAQVAVGGKVATSDLAGKWISPMHPEIVKDEPGPCDVCGMPLVKAEELGYVMVDSAAVAMPMVVPTSAVLRTGERAIVYVEVPDRDKPTYEVREVLLGAKAGDEFIIEDGVREGERVVTNGAFKIDSELQIGGKVSMMQPGEPADLVARRAGEALVNDQMKALLNGYFIVQQALANDQPDAAAAGVLKLADIASAHMKVEGLSADDQQAWHDAVMAIREGAFAVGADGLTVKQRRVAFEPLTHALIALSREFGTGGTSAYVVHCPMAFGNRGADWLSATDEVLNPYFGDMMLRCGVVKSPLATFIPEPKEESN